MRCDSYGQKSQNKQAQRRMRRQRARGRLGVDVHTDWLLVRECTRKSPYLYCRMRAPLDRGASSVSSTPRSKASTSTSPGGSGTEPGHAAVHTRRVKRSTAERKAPCLGCKAQVPSPKVWRGGAVHRSSTLAWCSNRGWGLGKQSHAPA